MEYLVVIYIRPQKWVLDQGGHKGTSLERQMRSLGFDGFRDVVFEKRIELTLKYDDQKSQEYLEERIHEMCDQLLCNDVFEEYTSTIKPKEEPTEE